MENVVKHFILSFSSRLTAIPRRHLRISVSKEFSDHFLVPEHSSKSQPMPDNTVKPVYNDHHYDKIYYMWFIQ